MGLRDTLSVAVQLPGLLALKKKLAPRPLEERDCFARHVERNAEKFGNRPAILFEGRTVTWREFNALANRYAHRLKARGIGRGDTVSVLMENRIEFLAAMTALNKLGAIAGLINTNLRERPLAHCINTTDSKACIFGEEMTEALAGVKGELPLREGSDFFFVPDPGGDVPDPGGEVPDAGGTSPEEGNPAPNWAVDLAAESGTASTENLPESREVMLGDRVAYLFTSGTTGLPKASIWSNRRFLASAGMSHSAGLKCTEKDRLYLCLPLYHGTGLIIGAGAVIASGASMFLRRRFSARSFLSEVREHRTNCLVYVGELCRYLANTPARPDDRRNPLETIIGNGLRPDVWMDFKKRFGIRRIVEFYGASEGNVAFANLMNKDCTVGMTTSEIALVGYDTDADEIVRDEQGRCIPVATGEPGLLLGRITEEAVFEGYTNAKATEQKILRNALETGDAWFNTGDLMREVDVGYTAGFPHYQFVDRVGDTFRWKSENVSTTEVGEIVNGHPQVQICNIYGVEIANTDGRAGMAALVLQPDADALDLEDFSAYVNRELPAYARPVFLRLQTGLDVTGTFKMVKGQLRKEGYDPGAVTDPLYVMKPGQDTYEPLDADFAAQIRAGAAGY